MAAAALRSVGAAPDAWRGVGGAASGVRVRDIMTWPALLIGAATTVVRATTITAEQGVHHLLVVRQRRLVGVLCTCDIDTVDASAPVAWHMTRRVITVSPNASLTQAADLMDDYRVDCLPSWWLGTLGMITRGDLVRYGVCERWICVACGDHHHVRVHPRYAGLHHCVDCLTNDLDSDADRLYRDLGGGD